MHHNHRISKRWLFPAALFFTAVVILAVYFLFLGKTQPGGMPEQEGTVDNPILQTQPSTVPEEQTLIPMQTDPVETTPTEESSPEESDPWTPPEESSPEEFDPWIPFEEEIPPAHTQPPDSFEQEELLCRQFARFTGQYVEDGRDELVENVAAMLVTNCSDKFLDLATFLYDIDGEDAIFVVTGLPAGASAWVMESERRTIPDNAVFTYLDCTTAFRDDVTADTSKVSIHADANMLTAVNHTDQTLEDVFIYYKTLHTDGNFFGGITYRVDFGTLEPGEAAQSLAGHYRGDKTVIVRIGWAGQ